MLTILSLSTKYVLRRLRCKIQMVHTRHFNPRVYIHQYPDNVQLFWISRQNGCAALMIKIRRYLTIKHVNRRSAVRLLRCQWNNIKWSCIQCGPRVHNDRANTCLVQASLSKYGISQALRPDSIAHESRKTRIENRRSKGNISDEIKHFNVIADEAPERGHCRLLCKSEAPLVFLRALNACA